MPRLVRSVADVPGAARMNPEQLRAVEAEGEVFVSAGELRRRIREELVKRDRRDLARQLDGAWISTIHGFCARLLRAHPFAVGIDPRFRELDEAQGAVVRGEAFERALEAFCDGADPERLRLLATYGADGLRRMLTGVYETLRSAGRDLVLQLGERAPPEERLPEALIDLRALRASGERAATFEETRKRLEQAALEELAARDRDLLQDLLVRFGDEYAAAKARESALDFEDLQLAARDLLRDDAAVRQAEQLRFRLIMVDEFQDTNRLQCEVIDLLAAGPAKEVFFVGDEFQSIYGFRHADVEVFRERREQAAQLLALTRNYRSRPEVLAAVNELFR